jgi:hypothetical protein
VRFASPMHDSIQCDAPHFESSCCGPVTGSLPQPSCTSMVVGAFRAFPLNACTTCLVTHAALAWPVLIHTVTYLP